MIRDGHDPQSICKTLLKCTTEQLGSPSITKCEVCTAVVDLIKFELTISNATVQVIIKAVEALCAILGDVPVYQEVHTTFVVKREGGGGGGGFRCKLESFFCSKLLTLL